MSRPSFAEATGKRAPSSGHGGMETLPQPADSSSPPAAQMTEKTAPPAAPLSVAESAPVANATTKQREEAGEKSGAVSEGDSSEGSFREFLNLSDPRVCAGAGYDCLTA